MQKWLLSSVFVCLIVYFNFFFFFNLRGVSHQEPILVGVFFLGVDRIISIETERQKYELSDAFQP